LEFNELLILPKNSLEHIGFKLKKIASLLVVKIFIVELMGLNSVTLVGRAGRDPEVRYFESGSVVANLTLAVNRRSKNDEPDWFNLEIWGKQAQVAADYVKKGSLIGINGSFKLDTWQDRKTGEPKSKPVVRVDRLELLGSKRDAENSGSRMQSESNGFSNEEEIPF
tara:strand:+ start:385 stop:885 length:501 start_codon:yes stop_codon:yes gene_type:complete